MWADQSAPRLGAIAPDQNKLAETLMQLHPWRKGPLQLGGCFIDTEWRSDWKWDRLAPHLDLQDKQVLDIGCGNGYFGWRMLAAGARQVVGIDPTLLFVMQWQACRHFAGDLPNYVLPLGIEDLPLGGPEEGSPPVNMDTVLSMGVLYHRRDPVEHLRQIAALLTPGGEMVLETLVLPSGQAGSMDDEVLVPENRYARMRNVWAVPGTGKLLDWVAEAGFKNIRLVDVTTTQVSEQRSTDWMKFESLAESLAELPDKEKPGEKPGRTLEGYPAPTRAMILAEI